MRVKQWKKLNEKKKGEQTKRGGDGGHVHSKVFQSHISLLFENLLLWSAHGPLEPKAVCHLKVA